ncbi:MAG: 4Fe-4S dicluster domain-containing protein, partial [Rhodospirillales bacterium]|nr:4Fe-4S dicluster domain-containing protein [Rhodospirillales bacterium]
DHCGTCTRCIDACPTQCIEYPTETGRRAMDAKRCISYLTLEHRSLIEPELHKAMDDWIAGCDVCQEVCPHNQEIGVITHKSTVPENARLPIHPRYAPRALADGIGLLEILKWTEENRRCVFRGSALKRMKLEMVQRNALIAAGNVLTTGRKDAQLRQRIEQLAIDPEAHELVRLTAKAVLESLRNSAERPPSSAPLSSDSRASRLEIGE